MVYSAQKDCFLDMKKRKKGYIRNNDTSFFLSFFLSFFPPRVFLSFFLCDSFLVFLASFVK